MKYAHIVRWMSEAPWAITAEKLAVMLDALDFLSAGGEYSAEEIAAVAGRPRQSSRVKGAVAVLPIYGVLSPRAGMLGESSGGTSVERLGAAFRELVDDPSVGAIVLDVDSPGGNVQGIDELSAEIFRARGTKPIIAVANHMAASAAYWLVTAADELVVTPSALVGSIGVYTIHEDRSAAYERQGVRQTIISAGKFKAEDADSEPLSDEARAAVQERIDEFYNMFVSAVARNRGVSIDDVRNGFGEGRIVTAKRAKALGMVDKIGTLEDTINRLASRGSQSKGTAAGASIDLQRRKLRLAAS